jgi:nickel/cobalt exporter
MAIALSLLFGLLQGLRHAFEPDHVVAISTMISEQRSARVRVFYAIAWGLGHAAMLLAVGAILMLLRAEIPRRVDAAFELGVSLMLIALGGRAVRHAVVEMRSGAKPSHGRRGAARGWRAIGPLAMGMVHGLAGSGALTAIVVAELPSRVAGLAFMAVFGAGATLGMSLLAGIAGVPLSRLLAVRWGLPALLGATGGISLLLGLAWLVPACMRLASS